MLSPAAAPASAGCRAGGSNGMFLKDAPPFAVRLPRSWPVLIATMGFEPTPLRGRLAEVNEINAWPKVRTQAKMANLLVDFMGFPFV